MPDIPSSRDVEVRLNMAISVDGFIDDQSSEPLILSNASDWDEVDQLRAWCDAILVGASTIRKDDSRLLLRNEQRRKSRIAQGRPADPIKVTLTASGQIDPQSRFLQVGEQPKIIYCIDEVADSLRESIGDLAIVVGLGQRELSGKSLLIDLSSRGLNKLLIEGGSDVATLFLQEGLVDEMRLAVAPFFVGENGNPRFVKPAQLPHCKGNEMKLKSLNKIDDVAVLTYRLIRND